MGTNSLYLASVEGSSGQRIWGHRNSGLEEGKVEVLQGNLNSNIKRLNVYHSVLQDVLVFISCITFHYKFLY